MSSVAKYYFCLWETHWAPRYQFIGVGDDLFIFEIFSG